MRKALKIIPLFIALIGISSFGALSNVEAAGPWKAQVVNAETGKPLEGVVILAVWYRYVWLIGQHGHLGYGASQEVVTNKEGRFTIASRSSWTLNPFVHLRAPDFRIFKPGYGQWRFHGSKEWPMGDVIEREVYVKEAWDQFEGKGVVMELPPLKTREERLKFYRSIGYSAEIPRERIKRFLQALEAERTYLGFGN